MTEPLVTLAGLLETGLKRTAGRLSLFLVLCLGAGLLMRLAYIPAESVLQLAFAQIPAQGEATPEELARSTEILNAGLWRIMLTQALLAAATAAALVLWTRAIEGRASFWSGYSGVMTRRRMLRSAFHLVVCVAVAVVLTLLIMMGVQILASLAPIPLLFLQALFAGLAFWCACFAFTVGHAAVVSEGRDRPVSLLAGLKALKGRFSAAVASLVVLTVAGLMLELTVGSLLTIALPTDIRMTGGLIILFGVMFAVSAVHCASLAGMIVDPRSRDD